MAPSWAHYLVQRKVDYLVQMMAPSWVLMMYLVLMIDLEPMLVPSWAHYLVQRKSDY